jgi:hypothetical protein
MGLAFLSVRPERFNFRVLDIAAQNTAYGDYICAAKYNLALLEHCVRRGPGIHYRSARKSHGEIPAKSKISIDIVCAIHWPRPTANVSPSSTRIGNLPLKEDIYYAKHAAKVPVPADHDDPALPCALC